MSEPISQKILSTAASAAAADMKLKEHFREAMALKTSSHSIAMGFAAGTLISIIIPVNTVSILLGLVLMLVCKGISKISLFVAFAFWNIVTLIPLGVLSMKVGAMLFGALELEAFRWGFMNQAYNVSVKYLAGSLVVGTATALVSYFTIRFIADFIRERRLHEKREPQDD